MSLAGVWRSCCSQMPPFRLDFSVSLGFIWYCRRSLRFCVACGRSRHHRCMGNMESTPLSSATKWHFHVSIAFSVSLVWRTFSGQICTLTMFSLTKLWGASGNSFSMRSSIVFRTWSRRYWIILVWAVTNSWVVWFFKGSDRMALLP